MNSKRSTFELYARLNVSLISQTNVIKNRLYLLCFKELKKDYPRISYCFLGLNFFSANTTFILAGLLQKLLKLNVDPAGCEKERNVEANKR